MFPLSSRRHALGLGFASVLAALSSHRALAGEPPVNTLNTGLLGGRGNTAINGYDPVAYFTIGKAVKGLDHLVHEWMGARWQFASQTHLDLFKADPRRYAPQYGGYCAYGVSQGYLVKVDPDQFTVRDGKLYLNYNAEVQSLWSRDMPGYIQAADSRFVSLLK